MFDTNSPGLRAAAFYGLLVLLLILILLAIDDADAFDSQTTTPNSSASNDPTFWGPSCIKLEPIPPDTLSFVASSPFSIVVLKSATTDDAFYGVQPGDLLATSTGQDISHIIKCDPADPTPTPSPTATATPTPTPSPSSTPTAPPTPTTTATATPTPPTPTITPTITPTATTTPTPTATPTPETPTPHPSITPTPHTPTPTNPPPTPPRHLADTGPDDPGLQTLAAIGLISLGISALIIRRIWHMDHP